MRFNRTYEWGFELGYSGNHQMEKNRRIAIGFYGTRWDHRHMQIYLYVHTQGLRMGWRSHRRIVQEMWTAWDDNGDFTDEIGIEWVHNRRMYTYVYIYIHTYSLII